MPIRSTVLLAAGLSCIFVAQPARAQAQDDEPLGASAAPENGVIDLLAKPNQDRVDERLVEECERETDAASISGEIIVCREITVDGSHYYSGDRDAARQRYADETQYADALQTPDVAGPGIFRGPATVGKLCIPGLQKCPPPPALIVDVTALPKAPPGSDADRIARGLPPIGNDIGDEPDQSDLLGLPATPEADEENPATQAGSAAPADPQ